MNRWARLIAWVMLAWPATSAAGIEDSLVVVDAYRGSRLQHELSGFVVAQDIVVTNANLLGRANRFVIRDPDLGTEITAEVLHRDDVSGIAILETVGLPGLEAELATGQLPEPSSIRVPQRKSGKVAEVVGHVSEEFDHADDDDPVRVFKHFRHTAVVDKASYGMPLLNECGQIAGVVRPEPGLSQYQLNRLKDPQGLMVATDVVALQAALVQLSIDVKTADKACTGQFKDAIDRAEQKEKEAAEAKKSADTAKTEAGEARKKAEDARKKAEELEKQSDASQAEKEAAQQAAEEARQAAEKASDLARQREEEAAELLEISEDAQAQVKSLEAERDYLYLALMAGAGVLVLVLLIWLLMSRRRRKQLKHSQQQVEEVEAELANAFKPASFGCLLEGRSIEDQLFAIKISAEDLGAKEGAVVGRNPTQSVAILDHDQASREHFKLLASGSELFIEDLESANGTSVNGRELTPNQMVALREGDEVQIGTAVTLRVKMI
ncbi:MAG: FHA domain-containing protein [Pseudomonadales bacterium]